MDKLIAFVNKENNYIYTRVNYYDLEPYYDIMQNLINHCDIYELAADQSNNILPYLEVDIFKSPEIQTFSLPNTIINYFLDASSAKVYRKINETCKYFYAKKRIILIPCVKKYGKNEFVPPATCLRINSCQLHKIWITTFLTTIYDRNDSYGLSKFCSKIYKCQANMITILHQKLKEDEFRLLVQPEFVRSLKISNTSIKRSNGSYFDGEDFVEAVPNAILIELSGISTSVNTFPNISKLHGKNQLIRFCYAPGEEDLYNFHSKFDVEMFKIFVTKNAAPKATFKIVLGVTQRELHDIDTRKIHIFLRSWVPKEHKPIIILANKRYV